MQMTNYFDKILLHLADDNKGRAIRNVMGGGGGGGGVVEVAKISCKGQKIS